MGEIGDCGIGELGSSPAWASIFLIPWTSVAEDMAAHVDRVEGISEDDCVSSMVLTLVSPRLPFCISCSEGRRKSPGWPGTEERSISVREKERIYISVCE